eukprot:1207192-Pleurochrysis_carterae.AAC.1
MSCVALGVGAPKTHWSEKMRPTPFVVASCARSVCVDMSACSFFPSTAKREFAPRETGDSNTKLPFFACVALAMRTQFATIAFARVTVAGRPPSLSGTPIGCSRVRRTCGAPDSNRAADHVEHG